MLKPDLAKQGEFFRDSQDWIDRNHLVEVKFSKIRSGDKLIVEILHNSSLENLYLPK